MPLINKLMFINGSCSDLDNIIRSAYSSILYILTTPQCESQMRGCEMLVTTLRILISV